MVYILKIYGMIMKERIDELVGQVPKIELFARQQVDGWDAWEIEI